RRKKPPPSATACATISQRASMTRSTINASGVTRNAAASAPSSTAAPISSSATNDRRRMQEKKRPSRSRESAGTLLYRRADDGSFAVLIVHPSGNYNRRDPWGIPKGLLDEGESLEEAARRETLEETGVEA